MIVETQIDAELRAGAPAFLERLEIGSTKGIGGEAGLEVIRHENRRALAMLAAPGQVFRARRWWRTGNADLGGTVWFTINQWGDVCPISESAAAARLEGVTSPVWETSEEVLTNVFCRPTSASGMPVIRGRL